MAINENVAKVLEDQINKELYSAYLYLTFADYYEDRGLKGFANWYMVQVLSLIHISEPTRLSGLSRMPSSA